jgi:hypothetical protein
MKWALAVTALRENKIEVLDAEYDHFNQLVAEVLMTRGVTLPYNAPGKR